MAGACEHLIHPVLGTLGWDRRFEYWVGQPTLSSGVRLDLIVNPSGGDRFKFLPRAAELFRWAIAHERAILEEAIRSYLLELYDDGWRQDDLPILDHAGFTAALEWQYMELRATDVSIEFGYDPGDLFGRHIVAFEVDEELQYFDSGLIG